MEVTGQFNFSSVVIEREQTVTLMVRVKAPPAPEAIKRKPLNLALVLDRSGSMGGDKLRYVRDAAKLLVNHLTAQDKLTVVIFDSEVETIVPPQSVVNKAAIKAAIDSVSVRAMTNLSGGWIEGLSLIEQHRIEDGINRVLLLSDGLANEGITDGERLCAIAAQFREKGITTSTLGFGSDFDENLLSTLADAGGGAFYFIENPDDAPAAFAEELGELLSVVGQNLLVEFHGRPPARFLASLNRYPTEALESGLRLRVGDLFADEQRELLAEMFVPSLPELGPRQLGEIVVIVDQVVEPVTRHRIAIPVEVNVVRPEEAPAGPDPEVAQAETLLRLCELRDEIVKLISQERFDGAQRAIADWEEKLRAGGMLTDDVQREFTRLCEEVTASMRRREYGSKLSHYAAYRSRRSRGEYRK